MIPNTIHFCFFENEVLNYLKASPTLIIVIILKIILSTKVLRMARRVSRNFIYMILTKKEKRKRRNSVYIFICVT